MRGAFLLSIALAAMVANVACQEDAEDIVIPLKCPEIDPTDKTIHIAHESDCTKFYKCLMGEKYLQLCAFRDKRGNRLHFNPKLQVCDWPARAGCIHLTTPGGGVTPTEPTPPPPSTTSSYDDTNTPPIIIDGDCPDVDDPNKPVHLPHEWDCRRFYNCENGKKVVKDCSKDMIFDKNTGVCTWPENANCTMQCPPKGSNEDASIPHECVCGNYYECKNGNQILRKCPNGLHFNRFTEECMDPEDAGCIKKPDPKPPAKCPATGSGMRLPHETSCSLYYQCKHGDKILRKCAKGLHFDTDLLVCDFPENAKCELEGESTNAPTTVTLPTTTETTTELTTESTTERVTEPTEITTTETPRAPVECPPAGSTKVVFLPHECSCTKYYICVAGDPFLTECADGLHYDYVRQVCDVAEKVKCVRPIPEDSVSPSTPGVTIPETTTENIEITTKLTETPEPATEPQTETTATPNTPSIPVLPVECPATDNGAEVLLPHEYECDSYYVCDNGKKIKQKCRKGLHFHNILLICDFPENVNCNAGPVPEVTTPKDIDTPITRTTTETITTTTKEIIPSECPDDKPGQVTFIPHEDKCSYYYRCLNGKKHLEKCKPGLHWDDRLQLCDWPTNCIDGGNTKPTPEPTTQATPATSAPVTESTTTTEKPVTEPEPEPTTPVVPDPTTPGSRPLTCPVTDTYPPVLLPHECYCSKYYLCKLGDQVLRTCPDGEHYDYVAMTCDRAEKVDCVRPIPGTINPDSYPNVPPKEDYEEEEVTKVPDDHVEATTPNSALCMGTCPEEDPMDHTVHLPHEDCTKFCKCSNGVPHVLDCPPKLHWSEKYQVCARPKEAKCKRPQASGQEEMVTKVPEIYVEATTPNTALCMGTCPEEDPVDHTVHLPHQDCTKYCQCSHGTPYVMPCPAKLHWSVKDNTCAHPRQAKCKRSLASSNEDFDEELVKMVPDNYVEAATPNTALCMGTCPEEDPMDHTVHLPHQDCTKYCQCSNGTPYVMPCPAKLHWSVKDNTCAHPRQAKCKRSLASRNEDFDEELVKMVPDNYVEATTSNTALCMGTCPEEDPMDHTVHLPHQDCTKYCQCSNGTPYVMPCPAKLHWSVKDNVCAHPRQAKCKRSFVYWQKELESLNSEDVQARSF